MAVTYSRIESTISTATEKQIACADCHRPIRRGDTMQRATKRNEGISFKTPFIVHPVCPARVAVVAAPIAAGVPAAAAATIKRAAYSSRCPGCGATIEAGSPLFFDSSIRRYVSDCCI